jgi:hypothetical protein
LSNIDTRSAKDAALLDFADPNGRRPYRSGNCLPARQELFDGGTACSTFKGPSDRIDAGDNDVARLGDSVHGPVDEAMVAEIVATGAFAEELREAWAWLNEDEALIGQGRYSGRGLPP